MRPISAGVLVRLYAVSGLLVIDHVKEVTHGGIKGHVLDDVEEIAERAVLEYPHISDNGPGVSQPDRIFDPFFTTKQVGEGTGLGLSICYGIVKEHGGEILCSNNSDDKGATFTVRLPIVTDFASLSAVAGVTKS